MANEQYLEHLEDLKKGGPGSGIEGHLTNHPELHTQKVVNLATKLGEPPNPFAAQLNKLENGAVMEGVNLRSGKPLLLNVDQAIAHGYTPQEHRESANVHYEKAKAMGEQLDKLKELKKPVPPEMKKIADFHRQNFRRHMNAADRVESTRKQTQEALDAKKKSVADKVKKSAEDFVEKASKRISPEQADQCVRKLIGDGVDVGTAYAQCSGKRQGMRGNPLEKCECTDCMVKKSVIMMGHQDAAEINTADFANEHRYAAESEWLHRFGEAVSGYNYGEIPREVMLDAGNLFLVKVEDGLYSGIFKTLTTTEDGALVDNAKVRIERMTLPSLVNFCLAKGWISHQPHVVEMPPHVVEPLQVVNPTPILTEVDVKSLRAIQILELISKLVGN